jgi:hypothetical protein
VRCQHDLFVQSSPMGLAIESHRKTMDRIAKLGFMASSSLRRMIVSRRTLTILFADQYEEDNGLTIIRSA